MMTVIMNAFEMQKMNTVFDLIGEHALISGHPLFPEILNKNYSHASL